jgi:hypothetical protein
MNPLRLLLGSIPDLEPLWSRSRMDRFSGNLKKILHNIDAMLLRVVILNSIRIVGIEMTHMGF